MDDETPRLIYAVLLLVVMASSLLAYRLPIARLLKMIAAWVAIFALAFVVMSFRPEMKMIWTRVTGELTGAPRQTATDETIKLTRQDDGHFWLRARINGHAADFMVDSGASFTAINADTARAAKLTLEDERESLELDTANGRIKVRTAKVAEFGVEGFVIDDHDVVVSESFGDTNVVGMNFLDDFDSWRVEGDVMTLRP